MEPVEVRDMVYALAVFEEKSFSRAAERCFVSQPSLSKAVKRLESNLGCVLFLRGASPVSATPDGERILEIFQNMLGLQRELELYCQQARRRPRQELTIAAPSFFCTCLLPPAAAAFQLEHPGCRIKLVECNDSELWELLRSGAADLGLSAEADVPLGLRTEKLKEERIILAVPAGAEINRGLEEKALTREELDSGRFFPPKALPVALFSQERFLLLRRGNDMYRRSMEICRDAGFVPMAVMELDQMLTAYYLAAAGEGVAFIRASIPHYAEVGERLRFYQIDHSAATRFIRLVYPEGQEPPVQRRAFLEFLKSFPLPG